MEGWALRRKQYLDEANDGTKQPDDGAIPVHSKLAAGDIIIPHENFLHKRFALLYAGVWEIIMIQCRAPNNPPNPQRLFLANQKRRGKWVCLIKNDAQNPKISGSHRKMKPM